MKILKKNKLRISDKFTAIANELEVYKNIFNNAKDIIILMDEHGNVINVNKEAIKSYGYDFNEFLKLNILTLRGNKDEKLLKLQLHTANLEGIEFEIVHYRKDGTPFLVEVKSVGIHVDSKECVISIIRDISLRKKNEQDIKKLASIVESSKDAIISKDLNGIINYWNKGAEALYGYGKDEVIGKDISIIIPNHIFEAFEEVLARLKDGETVENFETLGLKKNGELINISKTISGIFNSDLEIIGIASIERDITDVKLKEEELIANYEELSAVYEELTATEEELRSNYEELTATEEELKVNYFELEKTKEGLAMANKTKSQFIANMSHEIRTPMNGILGMQQLLELTEMDREQQEYLDMIKSSTYHLLSIINNILDISKIESGKASLNNRIFNLKEFLNKVIKELSIVGKAKKIEIMYFIDPFINNDLIGDEVRLNQIITNLINNATKFTYKGHIIFRVNKVSQSHDKIKLSFSIEDTGIGMSEDFKERIFKVFNQEDLSYTKRYEGTGLGLAISKQLVEMMNGEIWYESQLDKGSTFYFTAEFLINIKINDKRQEPQLDIKVNSEPNKKTILIVEDNTINMKIASEYLKLLGYNYLCATDGQEGLRLFNNNKVDLILMDIQMPVMNGYEACTAVREIDLSNHKHTQIVAMTAYAMAGDREKFLQFGMDEYISKPFDIHDLDKLLMKILNKNTMELDKI